MKRRPQSKQTNSDAIYGEIEIILPRKYVLQISWLVYHVETGFIFFFHFFTFLHSELLLLLLLLLLVWLRSGCTVFGKMA